MQSQQRRTIVEAIVESFISLAVLALVTWVAYRLHVHAVPAAVLYVCLVVLVSLRGSLIPALLVAGVSTVVWDYLLLLLVVTWLPFPTALIAEHLRGAHGDQQTAGVVYAASLLAIAIAFNVLWRYAIRIKAVGDDDNVGAITRQYSTAPVIYTGLLATALVSADVCLVISALYALYFASPPSLLRRRVQ